MFTLIAIVVSLQVSGEIKIAASSVGTFESFSECFAARESLSSALFGMPSGYFPPNIQAVCIPVVPPSKENS
jgi:hypothetical protein